MYQGKARNVYFLDGKRIPASHPGVKSLPKHACLTINQKKATERKIKKPNLVKSLSRENPGRSPPCQKFVSNPKWEVMIGKAIDDTNNRIGTSRYAISKYIAANYGVPEHILKIQLRLGIKRMLSPAKGIPQLIPNKGKYKIEKTFKNYLQGQNP